MGMGVAQGLSSLLTALQGEEGAARREATWERTWEQNERAHTAALEDAARRLRRFGVVEWRGRNLRFKPSTAKGGKTYELQYMPTNLHVQQMRVCHLPPDNGASAATVTRGGGGGGGVQGEVSLYTSITVGAPSAHALGFKGDGGGSALDIDEERADGDDDDEQAPGGPGGDGVRARKGALGGGDGGGGGGPGNDTLADAMRRQRFSTAPISFPGVHGAALSKSGSAHQSAPLSGSGGTVSGAAAAAAAAAAVAAAAAPSGGNTREDRARRWRRGVRTEVLLAQAVPSLTVTFCYSIRGMFEAHTRAYAAARGARAREEAAAHHAHAMIPEDEWEEEAAAHHAAAGAAELVAPAVSREIAAAAAREAVALCAADAAAVTSFRVLLEVGYLAQVRRAPRAPPLRMRRRPSSFAACAPRAAFARAAALRRRLTSSLLHFCSFALLLLLLLLLPT